MTVHQIPEDPHFVCDLCNAVSRADQFAVEVDAFEYDGELVVLYRPIGEKELQLIKALDWKSFPPRLSWQPIFYPVLNRQYAEEIAMKWNTKDKGSGFVGYVTKFCIKVDGIKDYKVKIVGGAEHKELWVPSEKLQEFNRHIVGSIEVIGEFRKQSNHGNGNYN